MHHIAETFHDLWMAARGGRDYPTVADLPEDWSARVDGFDVQLHCSGEDVVYGPVGANVQAVVDFTLPGSCTFNAYPEVLRPVQQDLLAPAVRQHYGFHRVARYWFGHRYNDIEWYLLPVTLADGSVGLCGVAAPHVAPDPRDHLMTGRVDMERIIAQSYLTLGRALPGIGFKSSTWAFLAAMKAEVKCDDTDLEKGQSGLAAAEIIAGQEASRPSLLFAGEMGRHMRLMSTMAKRYRVRAVQSSAETLEILERDRIDVVIVTEDLDDISGLDLLAKARAEEFRFSGGVLILKDRPGVEDIVLKNAVGMIHCLKEPIGEYALRLAIDDVAAYAVRQRSQEP